MTTEIRFQIKCVVVLITQDLFGTGEGNNHPPLPYVTPCAARK